MSKLNLLTISKGVIMRTFVLILSLCLLCSCDFLSNDNGQDNLHDWILDGGENIQYYEKKDDNGGFTSNRHHFLSITKKDHKKHLFNIGASGSYKKLSLYENSNKVVWLTGRHGGNAKRKTIAILNLSDNTFLGRSELLRNSADLTNSQKKLKYIVESSKGTKVQKRK